MSNHDAWVIYLHSAAEAPRDSDDPFIPWAWGEAIAVLPPDASSAERAAALVAVSQAVHFMQRDRSDILDMRNRDGYFWGLARQDYLDALHPYLACSRARNLRHESGASEEQRGRVLFDVVPHDE